MFSRFSLLLDSASLPCVDLGVAGSTPALGLLEQPSLEPTLFRQNNSEVFFGTNASCFHTKARLAQSVEHKTLIGGFVVYRERRERSLFFCFGDCIVALSQIVALLTPVRFRVAEHFLISS